MLMHHDDEGSPQRVFRARASAGLHTRTCMTLLAWLKLRGMLSSVKEAPPVSGRLLAGVLDERMNGSRSSSGSHADLPLRSAPHPHSHIHISRIHVSQPPQTHERTNTAAPLAEHRVCVRLQCRILPRNPSCNLSSPPPRDVLSIRLTPKGDPNPNLSIHPP